MKHRLGGEWTRSGMNEPRRRGQDLTKFFYNIVAGMHVNNCSEIYFGKESSFDRAVYELLPKINQMIRERKLDLELISGIEETFKGKLGDARAGLFIGTGGLKLRMRLNGSEGIMYSPFDSPEKAHKYLNGLPDGEAYLEIAQGVIRYLENQRKKVSSG